MSDVKYTEFAQQAVGLADLFNAAFKKPLPGSGASYRVQLAVPDGPSTAGGKQGTQHIKLVPAGGGATLVAGWANPADCEAQVRSWEHLKAIAQERGGGALPDEQAYRALVLDLKRFFERERMLVSVVAAPRRADDEGAAGPEGSNGTVIVLGVVGGLALVAIALLLLMR